MPPPHSLLVQIALLVAATCLAPFAQAVVDESILVSTDSEGHFTLVGQSERAVLFIDSNDHWGAKRAVEDLAEDIGSVTEQEAQIVHEAGALGSEPVIIGTLGKSPLISRLQKAGKLDLTSIEGKWDAFQMEVVEKPLPGVNRALVIVGANMRGTIYGVYTLSEQIGVSPWHFWADVPSRRSKTLYIDGNLKRSEAPKVKYRGIFLNDEAPALTGWVKENYGTYNSEFYAHVFELILRLKGNFLWPAMWDSAFAIDDPQNPILADSYGIVMSNSHHEPMMRSHKEWKLYGEGPWDYSQNPETLREFWKSGIENSKEFEKVITLAMRGDGDEAMSEEANVSLLEKVVRDQRKIISDLYPDKDIEQIPQVWALYKEVQEYYEKGMRVPDDVILLWCDDNWGNIRRLPSPEERKRSGGAGVYYHFDYVGGPRSYRWINVIQLAKIWEQMNLADKYEANQIWVVNVGDLKPMELPITYFLDLAWNIDQWPKERIPEYSQTWAREIFGTEHAKEIADLLDAYTRHNGRRKPELQEAKTYSILNFRESERILSEIEQTTEKAEQLYDSIPPEYKDAFFELVLYPVKASGTITRMYIAQAMNHLYAQQGRSVTNVYADLVERMFDQNKDLADDYHHEVASGKWNHMMSQPRIGYTHWNNPPADHMPPVMRNRPHDQADMGVALEGSPEAWPQEGAIYELPTFYKYGQSQRYIEVFNKGTAPFDYTISTDHDWITLSKTSGTVVTQERIIVSIDWNKLSQEKASGSIVVKGTGWGSARIAVRAKHQSGETKGFIEADGYVSIDAENVTRKTTVEGYQWEIIPGLGRTKSSISVFPVTDKSFEQPALAPRIEYDVTLFDAAEYTVEVYFAPTLPFMPDRGLRYAVGFDDAAPLVVDLHADRAHSLWQTSVRDGVKKSLSRHQITQAGTHTLKIYSVDPGVTLQKILIYRDGLPYSYLGPPQSVLEETTE